MRTNSYPVFPALSRVGIGSSLALLLMVLSVRADMTIGPWVPLFKGVEHAVAHMTPGNGDANNQAVNVLRIDLTDPDIELQTTPPRTNYVAGSAETSAQTVSSFLAENKAQVAVNANFYSPVDAVGAGGALKVTGLHISRGFVVSSQETLTDSAAFLFTTNNQVTFIPTNFPPTNVTGIYTAVSGRYPLLIGGQSVANDRTSLIPGLQPRTAYGVTQDRRYLLLMTIDGRQSPYSDGSLDSQTAEWLLRFGAWDAVNMDGGGSTTMVAEDCQGNPAELNSSSYVAAYGRERYIGSHLGIHAKPLSTFISNIHVDSAGASATVTWVTETPATSLIEYGPSTAYGSTTPLDSNLDTSHQMTLGGLVPGTTNYFIIHAVADGVEYTAASCSVVTNTSIGIFPFSQVWRYQTNNLDGVAWTASGYDDSHWMGQGPGLLYAEDNPNVAPKGTGLPPYNGGIGKIPITYYFRTHFTFTNSTAGVTLSFSNYLDDGAVFYLNGVEIQRVRMPSAPQVITNTTLANGANDKNACGGDAITTCPVLFTVSGSTISGLVKGDNVLAVELHNFNAGSPDAVFGTALNYSPGPQEVLLAPIIMDQPASIAVDAGKPATFAATASGTDPLVYAWFFNGARIPGASSFTYTIPAVTPGNAGNYQVTVSNMVGVVTSQVAVLTVNGGTPPVITQQPASTTVVTGQPASFAVSATGATGYLWYFNSGAIAGATAPGYSIPAAAAGNAGDYKVVVSNTSGSVTSVVAHLTVTGPPKLTLTPSTAEKSILSWTGTGFILQQSGLESKPPVWVDVPGPVVAAPYTVTNSGPYRFFRLRN
ncbi:MAG TPA: hypothetical protein DCM86_20305 [Verrucomicrobiales bacterium]|nr:hypothetical protein [Verrucomicrobiales bacterium]